MKLASLKRDIPKRAVLLAIALVAAASMVTGREKPSHEVVEAAPPRLEQAAAAPDIDLAKLQQREAEAAQSDPFAPRDFAPAPAPAPARQRAASAPEAPKGPPPLPFTYAGWLTQDGKTEVLVVRGEEILSIAAGQNIDSQYRVDSISDERIGFTYLPLKKRQVLERVQPEGDKAG
jgi:hypothetical protein